MFYELVTGTICINTESLEVKKFESKIPDLFSEGLR
jgi:hypothetical protein